MAPLLALLVAGLVLGVSAHPGHSVEEEATERTAFMQHKPKSVHSCASQLSKRNHAEEFLARRQAVVAAARTKRELAPNGPAILRRDFANYNYTHASNKSVNAGSDENLLFDDNSSCMLQPEVTQGPYYVDGELIRGDIVEQQEGVPLNLIIQLIDTSTCSPVPAMFVDIWHCNATGVYSGVSAAGNGNSESVTSNLNATFLRGIQETDINGIVQVATVFPGHYDGRATHIHLLAHALNDTIIRTNHTLLGSNSTTHASHVGQIFFDQSLISEVEAVSPYSSNTQTITLNSEDSILASEADTTDPFAEYVVLGDLTSGIMAWITIGIDSLADNEITSAATHYETGGVANSDSDMGSPLGGNGTMPKSDGQKGQHVSEIKNDV